jgi:hypothetical protein
LTLLANVALSKNLEVAGTLKLNGNAIAAETLIASGKLTIEGEGVVDIMDIYNGKDDDKNYEITIIGGTYTIDVSEYCLKGFASAKNSEGKYTVAKLPNAEVKDLGNVTVGPDQEGVYGTDSYYVYDLVGGSGLKSAEEPFDLQIAMNFKAKDTAEEAAANAFGNYTTDFFITMTGLANNGSFVADGCFLAGYYPSFKAWVKIPLDGFTVENGKVYLVITSAGFDFKYTDICGEVKDFICGIYLTPEVLAANPDLKVELSLGLSEDMDAALATKFMKVDSYVYDAEQLAPAVAQIGETKYNTLQAAVDAATEDATITMLCDVELAEAVTIPAGKVVTLDLNGKTVSYTSAVVGEDMITNNGNLTINSSVEGGKITYNNTDETGQNVTISTISACPGSTLVVNGGTIENTSVGVSSNVNVAYTIDILTNGNLGDVNVTINGGTVYSDYMAIRQFNNGTACKNSLTINDGHIYGAKRAVQVHMDNNAAVTAINGGKVEAGEGGYALCNFAATSALKVTGGELIGAVYSASEGFITGGTFSEEPYSGYIAEHYEAVLGDNGYYGIEAEEGYIPELEITYGEPFENSSVKTVGKLTYNRTISTSNVGKWQPLYIPFPAPVSAFGEKVEIATPYDVNATDENGDGYADGLEAVYLLVNKGATLRANYPYMIKVNDEASCEISVVLEDVILSTSNEEDQNSLQCGTMFSDFIFAGSYNTLALDASLERTYETQRGQFQLTDNEKSGATILSMSSGTWYKNTTQDIAAHRVYIVMYNFAGASYISENAMKSIGVRIIGEENEDGTTVIYDVEVDRENDDAIYDLQGRRVLETEKGGIYIKGGKKFIAQ